MPSRSRTRDRGPFQADQLKDGDRYELSNARSILTLLEGRGLSVDATVRERVTGCRNAAELERWLLRAAEVQDAQQLFD